MFLLVTGGSGSGKSSYAEKRVCETAAPYRYYIATMQVYGEEGRKKVQRHQEMRAAKNFVTLEWPVDVYHAVEQMENKGTALLECISNLVANEMFRDGEIIPEDQVVDKVIRDVELIHKCMDTLVVVTSNVYDDGITYEEGTMAYIRAMGRITQMLARMADEVVEVVVGIPVVQKRGK